MLWFFMKSMALAEAFFDGGEFFSVFVAHCRGAGFGGCGDHGCGFLGDELVWGWFLL